MEVGPLARYVVGYAQGHEAITEQVDSTLRALDVPFEALFSTLGRTAGPGAGIRLGGRLYALLHGQTHAQH